MRAGQIVEHLALRDDLGLLQQLGVLPAERVSGSNTPHLLDKSPHNRLSCVRLSQTVAPCARRQRASASWAGVPFSPASAEQRDGGNDERCAG